MSIISIINKIEIRVNENTRTFEVYMIDPDMKSIPQDLSIRIEKWISDLKDSGYTQI